MTNLNSFSYQRAIFNKSHSESKMDFSFHWYILNHIHNTIIYNIVISNGDLHNKMLTQINNTMNKTYNLIWLEEQKDIKYFERNTNKE